LRGTRRDVVGAARSLRHADREPRRRHPARPLRARRGGSRPLRGHEEDPDPPRPPPDRGASSQLPPPQRGSARRRDPRAARARGERVALVADAGLPGVSDPGARLVEAAVEAGVPVTVLPGASAVETALVASGLGAERYQFVGYLPRREAQLEAIARELARWPH